MWHSSNSSSIWTQWNPSVCLYTESAASEAYCSFDIIILLSQVDAILLEYSVHGLQIEWIVNGMQNRNTTNRVFLTPAYSVARNQFNVDEAFYSGWFWYLPQRNVFANESKQILVQKTLRSSVSIGNALPEPNWSFSSADESDLVYTEN